MHGVKSIVLEPDFDFSKCIFCQSDRSDAKPSNPTQEGYESLSRDIAQFVEFYGDLLPKHVKELYRNKNDDLQQICAKRKAVEQHVFKQLCTKNKAVYHKQCRNDYNSQKLDRLNKSKKNTIPDEGKIELCIFCEKPGNMSTVWEKETISKIVQQAELANDILLLQRISNSSQLSDIKYHKPCYIINTCTKPTVTVTTVSNQIDFTSSYNLVLDETINQIEKTRYSPEQEFFKLSQLTKVMTHRLVQMGFDNYVVHSSRLKDQLLSQISGLRADKIGREIFLFFDENVKYLVANAIENDLYDDDAILEKAVEILRRISNIENTVPFTGSLNKTFCAERTVPKKLVNFLSSWLEGLESNSKISQKVAENIAQIILFNCVKRRKCDVSYARHNIDREQPFPIYMGLMIHSETGQRKLVDELHDMGLSISYSRVLEIEKALAGKVCDKYIADDCVCPPSLIQGIFTTAAIDNIDHNPTSSSANYSFHGTGISLMQHFNHQHNEDSQQHILLEKSDFSTKRKALLPDNYYIIPMLPGELTGQLPVSTVNWNTNSHSENPLEYTKDWLESSTRLMDTENAYENVLSWGAFNSQQSTDISSFKSTSAMLPLIKDDINSPAVVAHALDLVIAATKKLNPTQTPVNTADEPVYAIAKQLQWSLPDKYGEDKIVLMLGGLHIEKSFLAVIGTWLEGSGWNEALVKSGITTTGRCEGILKSSHIKRARYAHEVSLTALNIVLFEQFEIESESDNYFQWIEDRRGASPQFEYWITVMKLEAILLQFVKCLRTADIEGYVKIIDQMCPWYLLTDHTHYGRWLPIFNADMKRLPEKHPEIYAEFRKGHFTSRRTNKNFSCISDDQFHEQNNKIVKESATLLGSLNDESSLVKWMVSGPELTRLIMEYRDLSTSNFDLKHHEDTKAFQSTFRRHVKALVKTLENKGPFCTAQLTTIGIERKVMDEAAGDNVRKATALGLKKYQEYVSDRLVTTKISIHERIKQSQLHIFKILPGKSINKDKMRLSSANADSNLFCRLYIECESREGNIDEFFNHENNRNPPSISEFGKIRQSTGGPDEMVKCLYKSHTLENVAHNEDKNASILVLNATSVSLDLPPKSVMTVKEYSSTIFNKYIYSKCESYNRIDVVYELNQDNSLIAMTRENSVSPKYLSLIDNETKLPTTKTLYRNWFNNPSTKKQFVSLLKSNLIDSWSGNKRAYVTDDSIIIFNNSTDYELTDISSISISPEDTNARLLLHVENAVINGHENITLITNDFNAIVVAMYAFKSLLPNIKKLWIELSNDGRKFTAAIHDLYETNSEKCELLPFFHAFTGNHPTTSVFNSIGKKTAWNIWNRNDELDSAVLNLMENNFRNWNAHSINILEGFVMQMYDSKVKFTSLGDCRRVLFTVKNRPIDKIPPTRDALEQHVKRAVLQASIWTQCLQKNRLIFDPNDWGWEATSTGSYTPKWTTIPILADHCQELIACKCKGKCNRCKCALKKLPCTKLCTCKCDKLKQPM